MSRRYLPSASSQHPFISHYTSDNTYQATTLPKSHTYCNPLNTKDCCDISETCTNVSSYHNSYEYHHIREPKVSDCIYSDSDANSFQSYSLNEDFNRRSSHVQSFNNKKSVQKVYPTNERISGNPAEIGTTSFPHRLAVSKLSDRPRSALSATSTIVVDGCGGHCQTFENVCYYFMQVAFTMGILIGVSLTIAGAVLSKSAARNLQVLMYIGVMLALVSFVLLYIQCTARYSARKRKKVIRSPIREPIPMVPMESVNTQPLTAITQLQQPLMDLHSSTRRYHRSAQVPLQLEQQGIPWWRRKEP